MIAALGCLTACRTNAAPALHDAGAAALPARGGALVAAIRGDPGTFNPYTGRGTSVGETLTHLLHGALVRVNRRTGELEPRLAESWSQAADGVTWTLKLRRDVRFSDGQPFTSADVVFAFAAVYDATTTSAIGDAMLVNGKPIAVSAPDSATLVLRYPAPTAVALQLLENLPILPRHKLDAALRRGALKQEWTLATTPAEVVGLGPFRLAAYRSSETIELERNPFYWGRDERGRARPYLDRLTLAIVRDQNTERLRLENGQIDIGAREIRADDYATLRRDEARGRLRLVDAGIGLDPNMLWFNLSPDAYPGDPRKQWLQSADLRRAISLAVDRRVVVDQVYLGAAVPVIGPVTPGNTLWYDATAAAASHDPARAAALLDALGLRDRDGDGMREDDGGRPARFSVLTQQQDTVRMRTMAVVQEQLRRLGLAVDIVGVDTGLIVQRWGAGKYDAIYFGVESSSFDPANNLDFWLSSGSFHLWHAEQRTPATDWERRIDALMRQQAVTHDPSERQRLFADAQRVLTEQQPVICFAAPRVIVALSSRVTNAMPAPLKPMVLWNAETLGVTH